ncbi:BPL-N domain-containing protein [Pseudonocardia sp. ICBG162]|uniref:BPL-N domain-containing protein n=1 Tax=Pseudonocardia sp. ICBG162 TaxID=2846761 RepID=UPI001CF707B2|nr:BPL-N domain-containing protein [Pseudonocardia sp. ICBG162]
MDRRTFLTVGALTVAAGLAGRGVASAAGDAPLALIHRGPSVTAPGSPETLQRLLAAAPLGFRTEFVGAGEDAGLSPEALSRAALYVQPGGGTVDEAWPVLERHAGAVADFVRGGGTYLGFCLGAYLAGRRSGFGLFDGTVRPAAGAGAEGETVTVDWRGTSRRLYFQDGAAFDLPSGSTAEVLATYTDGSVAALAQTVGRGRIGLVGAHPEADETWFSGPGYADNTDLARDLVTTAHRSPAA